MRTSARGAIVAIGALVVSIMGGTAAWAADEDYPLTVDPGSVAPGEEFTVSGESCLPAEDADGVEHPSEVRVTFEDEVSVPDLGDDGTWSRTLTAPEEPGDYDVTAVCDRYTEDVEYAAGAVQIAGEATEEPTTEEPTEEATEDPVFNDEIVDITRDVCEVAITTEVAESGGYGLEVWDDGDIIDSFDWTMTEPGTHVVNWTITRPALEQAPGVGFSLTDADGATLDSVDPWEYPAEVAQECYEATLPTEDGDDAGTAPSAGPAGEVLAATGVDGTTALGAAGILAAAGAALMLARRGRVTHSW